jgi:hypothetical protein
VLWRLKSNGGDTHASLERIRAALEAQQGRIPGLLRVEIGLNARASKRAADFALICEFADMAALAAYHRHPAHLETRAVVDPLVDEHWIVDYEVPAPVTRTG